MIGVKKTEAGSEMVKQRKKAKKAPNEEKKGELGDMPCRRALVHIV